MKAISVRVEDETYHRLASIAHEEGRPIAAVVREAAGRYLRDYSKPSVAKSLLDIEPRDAGRILSSWSRSDLYDDMRRD